MITLFQYYRIVAAFLILMIHQQFWKPCGYIGGLENAAVPLFACMAGYLYKGDLLKKVPRVVIPYFIWAVIYFFANNLVLDVFLRHNPFVFPGLKSWLLGGIACHLWFLPSLFVCFAARSLLQKLIITNNLQTTMTINLFLFTLGVASQWLPGETSFSILGYCRIYFGRLLLFFALGGLICVVTSSLQPQLANRTNLFAIHYPLFVKIMGGGRNYAWFC